MYQVFSLSYPYDGEEVNHGLCEFWSLPHDGKEGAVERREEHLAEYRKNNTEAVVMIREIWLKAKVTPIKSEEPPRSRRPWHT